MSSKRFDFHKIDTQAIVTANMQVTYLAMPLR